MKKIFLFSLLTLTLTFLFTKPTSTQPIMAQKTHPVVSTKRKPTPTIKRIFHCYNYKLPAKERKIGKIVPAERLKTMQAKKIATIEIPGNQFARDAAYYCKAQYKIATTAVISIIDKSGKLAFVGTARLTPKETARLDIKKVKFSK